MIESSSGIKGKAQSRNFAIGKITGSVLEAESIFLSPDYPDSYLFPWNPDSLVSGNNYKIYDEMRDDDQVKVAIALKKDMVVNTGWEIDCEEEEIKEYITNDLENIHDGDSLDSTFEDVLRDMMTSYEYGFSLAEVVYKIKEENLYGVKCIKVRPPQTFRFDLDEKGNVIKVIQTGNRGELLFEPSVFMHHVYQQEFGNPYGKSDLKAAHTAYKIKKHFQKFFAVYVERFASPTIVGKYPAGMTDDEISRVNTVIKSIQNHTTLTMPDNIGLDFMQSSRDASDVYIKGLNFFNMMISRAILVPDLLGIGGEKTTGGSYALGEKQFELFLSTIKKDRESLQRKITQKVIKPMVKANWGDVRCQFIFKPFSDQDELEMVKVWSETVKGNVYKPTDDEVNHFRRAVGFPEGEVEIPEKAGTSRPFSEKEFVFSRELTGFEKKVNFGLAQKMMRDTDDEITGGLTRLTKEIYMDWIEQVISSKAVTGFKPEKVETIQFKFLKPMKRFLEDQYKRIFRISLEQAQKEILPSATKKFVTDDIMPDEFEEMLTHEAFNTVGDYVSKMSLTARNMLLRGIKDGLSEGELVKLLKEKMGDQTEVFIAQTVRTKTTEIYNAARKTFYDTDPIAREIIEAFQYSAIMDSRTSDVCRYLDGKIFLKGELTDRITPPLHNWCRSVLVPITRYEDYKSDDKFVSRGKEPSIDSLKMKGGNLIVG